MEVEIFILAKRYYKMTKEYKKIQKNTKGTTGVFTFLVYYSPASNKIINCFIV